MTWLQWRVPELGRSKHGYYFDQATPDNQHWGWSWLERWMSARPWENRMLDNESFRRKPHFLHETESSVVDSTSTPPAASKSTKMVSPKAPSSILGSIMGSIRDYNSISGSIRTSPTRSRGSQSFHLPSTTGSEKQVWLCSHPILSNENRLHFKRNQIVNCKEVITTLSSTLNHHHSRLL